MPGRASKDAPRLGKRSSAWFFAATLLTVAAPAAACDLASAPTDRWSVANDNGVQWLKTPCGERFYSIGVNTVNAGYDWREKDGKTWYSWTAFDPSIDSWVTRATRRLGDWGFNTAGGWSLPPAKLPMPSVINL